jgi:hypothetical protein
MLACRCLSILPGDSSRLQIENITAMDEGIDSCSIGVKRKMRDLFFYLNLNFLAMDLLRWREMFEDV